MNILRRELAPISEAAWSEIDDQARRSLRTVLTVRQFADVRGPFGLDYVAVPKGRLTVAPESTDGVEYGVNRAQPLLEVRVPFSLNIWELDNVERGARDIDLEPVDRAVWKLAQFEESSVYHGFSDGSLVGLRDAATQPSIAYDDDPEEFLRSVARGITQLRTSMVQGPYALVVTEAVWNYINNCVQGRPLKHHLEYILGGPAIYSPFIDTPMLVSMRGGDLELTLGQDIAVGYKSHDSKQVELYLTESFTFQTLEPNVVVFFTR
jgi:uncharacterized linocin/CFP29 family protein